MNLKKNALKNIEYMIKKIILYLRLIRYIFSDIVQINMTKNSVAIEASSMCQLRCPICNTAIGITKKSIIGNGYLKFQDFKNFIDDNLNIKNIELSNWGEMFLNPDLKKIIKYAYFKKIKLTAGNGVNLNDVDKECLEYLVKYKFKFLNISLDGASNETYKIYRRGGNFNRVIENIKIINYYKKKYNSNLPILQWQFIIFGHNEHELPTAREMAKSLNMRFITKLNFDPSFSPIKNKEFVKKESKVNVTSRNEFKKKYKKDYSLPCYQFWKMPHINWDGKLIGCCINQWGHFGNVFKDGLNNCLKSKKYILTKKILCGKSKITKDIPCYNCTLFKDIFKNPIKMKDIF